MITLTESQEKCLKTVIDLYKKGQKVITIAGYAGSGKAQPNDTTIPTPSGEKLLGDIEIGDYVFDRKGKPTKVIGVYPQGEKDIWKVTLSDGRTTYCNDEHLWSYYTSKGNLKTAPLKSMLDFCRKDNRGHNYFTYKIPTNGEIEFNKQENLKIHPYTLGVLLGDGCCFEKYLTISSQDEEIVNRVASLQDFIYHKNSNLNYNWNFYNKNNQTIPTLVFLNEVKDNLIQYSYDKSIPNIYKNSSIEQRWELIKGLMDTGGSIIRSEKRYNIRYTSTSLKLIKDVQWILQSLGISSTLLEDKREDEYTKNICYNLNINCPDELKYKFFYLKRKREIVEEVKNYKKRKDYSKISIVNIEKIDGKKEMTCIKVDNEEHLYLTNDFIVTHNTTIINALINQLNMENNTAYVTFTGKASLVLREKGLPATTIHKLIYECQTDKFGNLEVFLKQDIDENIKIIVIDEISMVSKELLQDLLKFNRQIIALGDIGQLEPIGDDNGLLKKPDYVLTEIIRQAADNPIIYLSKLVRENKFDRMNNDKVKVLSKKDFDLSMVEWADQCLCGFNQTRKFINESMRKYYFNIKFDLPVVGDKVISLKNCWKTLDSLGNPLINGTICKIKNINASVYNGKIFKATLQDVDTSATYSKLQIDTSVFKNEPIDFKKKLPVFDYGYAITTHKAQGSEYNKVLLIDECLNKETYNRWLYTAITRAKDKLVIIKD